MISAKDIIIPVQPATLSRHTSSADVNAIFRRLRQLKASFAGKANSNDRVAMLIAACIDEGIDTEDRIIGSLRRLDYERKRAVTVLRLGVGKLWASTENGQFRNLI